LRGDDEPTGAVSWVKAECAERYLGPGARPEPYRESQRQLSRVHHRGNPDDHEFATDVLGSGWNPRGEHRMTPVDSFTCGADPYLRSILLTCRRRLACGC